MVKLAVGALALLAGTRVLAAQSDSGRVRVAVRAERRPVVGAEVSSGRARVRTDRSGEAVLRLPVGRAELVVTQPGFRVDTLRVVVERDLDTVITTELVEQAAELASVVVTATRVSHLVEDEPTRVEVLAGEEIEEKTQTQPGNLTQLLQEVSGVRVQPASAGLGAAGIRIQGLPAPYTAILTDGLPLSGAQFGELSLAQVPPLDLKQAEVIKGSATALFGVRALGGVVNLVSRPPTDEREVVLNQAAEGGTDALTWLSKRWGDRWGVTFLGGVHAQTERDIDGDGWADVAGFRRLELRPRVYWSSAHGASVFATVGAMSEGRRGGTLRGALVTDSLSYSIASNTNRVDGGAVGVLPLGARDTLTIRAAATSQWEREDFGPNSWFSSQHGRHASVFSEATLTIPRGWATWLLGTGFDEDAFRSPELPGFEYTFTTPSVFAQTTLGLGRGVAVTASGRCDWHSRYGTFCSPRVSTLLRGPAGWSVRLSGATGFSAPTPFIDETEGIPLALLVPFNRTTIVTCSPSICSSPSDTSGFGTSPFSIKAARARYASLDVTKRTGPINLTATLFGSVVDHVLILSTTSLIEGPQLINADGAMRTAGGEFFGVYGHEPFVVLLEYAYVHSTMAGVEAPLTPRHTGGVDLAWESDETHTRVALHVFYTGSQRLQQDPYRRWSPPYTTTGLLVSQRLGMADLYVSGEDLGDVRQTNYDPLLLPAPTEEHRWTTEVWAPLQGRVVNAGVRLAF